MGKKASSKFASSSSTCNKKEQPSMFPTTLFCDKPKLPLTYNVLLKDYIWTVDNILSSRECQQWIDYMEQQSLHGNLDYTQQRATRYMAARECFRLQNEDSHIAQCIFERIPQALLHLLPPPTPALGCNPNIRLYKYCKGHSFGMHVDECNIVPAVSGATSSMMTTRVTILIYLSECHGGATRFQSPQGADVAYAPKAGSMLLHLHGDDCLPHQGDVVQGGIKYVLRTDLVYAE